MIKDEIEKVFLENIDRNFFCEKHSDILIMGPTGCGKTSAVREWLFEHRNDTKQRNWLANCYPHAVKVMFGENGQKVACSPWVFDSETVNAINRPDAVFVIDHFDLTDDEVRKQMLSLVQDREVFLYTGEKVKLEYGPLMIIAIAFEDGAFGYEPLSSSDQSAFEAVLHMHY